MKRRELLKRIITSAAGVGALSEASAIDASSEWDRFGGWKGKRFKATGFFRAEHKDRWWLVTPEGNAFLSFGINHLHPDLWKHDYNREAWMERLQLDDLNTPKFAPALRTWFLKTCKEYGFNTLGMHASLSIANTPKPAIPYILPIRFVDIPHWKVDVPDAKFADVFSDDFTQHCDQMAKRFATKASNDPFLLGYAMTDCPLFTEEDCRERPDVIGGARRKGRIGWPRRLRNLGSNAPGKEAYVATMRNLYRDQIQEFNATYSTAFESFDSLASAKDWRPHTELFNENETRDNVTFLKAVVTKYYKTARDAIRRYDTNHMFFGDKLNANTDAIDTLLTVTSKFTDVVFYQMYGRYEVQKPGLDRWSHAIDKPVINGDSAYTMITDHMPRPFGPVADNVQQRAEWTAEFFQRAFARPEFVGWHYCGMIDAPNQIARKQARQHSGLMDGFGTPHPELKRLLKTCSDEMYITATTRLSRPQRGPK